jgi:AcrR family transcriptional regulator
MTRKRDVIVSAALRAFLEEGYAGSSVNRIAEDAGVSIKTLYRHFTGKDDLFAAVMLAACTATTGADDGAAAPWLSLSPREALPMMAESCLRDIFSKDQIALYRVVARDSALFPEIGRMYHTQIIERRLGYFVRYAERWAVPSGWPAGDWRHAAQVFASLMDAGVVNEAVLLNRIPEEQSLIAHAERAASNMLFMIASGRFTSESRVPRRK